MHNSWLHKAKTKLFVVWAQKSFRWKFDFTRGDSQYQLAITMKRIRNRDRDRDRNRSRSRDRVTATAGRLPGT